MRDKHAHIQAIREGRDYYSPVLALNDTIEGLVHSGLIIRHTEDGTLLTPEARALDAIGVQVERELITRRDMIVALSDRLTWAERVIKDAQSKGYVLPVELVYKPKPASLREAITTQLRTPGDLERVPHDIVQEHL
jgi:hypothetical protein